MARIAIPLPCSDPASFKVLEKQDVLGMLIDTQCPGCASIGTFSVYHYTGYTIFDIGAGCIPISVQRNEVKGLRIEPHLLPSFWTRCSTCEDCFNLVPQFKVIGTRLTRRALLCIAWAYSIGKKGWRSLEIDLTGNEGGLHFTTLFKAVHSLGKSLPEELLEVLRAEYPDVIMAEGETTWPEPRSIFDHTRKQERSFRGIVATLLHVMNPLLIAVPTFRKIINAIGIVLHKKNLVLVRLY